MSTYKIELPDHHNWKDAKFNSSSLWGNGNNGKNLWGWTGGAALKVSSPMLMESNNKWFIEVTAENPGPSKGEELAFISRYTMEDGNSTKGVLSTMKLKRT